MPVLAAATLFDQERRHVLGVILDMSEQKAEERRKQEFLSMVSHELRTPLTVIQGSIVQEVVINLQQAIPTREIDVVLPPGKLVPVFVDAGRIGQVLSNYLTNAFKYAPVDEEMSVHLEVEASVARVSVRDLGPGLTPEQQ
jgi:signal transduction histidine kinase